MQFINSPGGDSKGAPVIPWVTLSWPQGSSVHRDVYLRTNNKIGFLAPNQSRLQL